ncbi:hypothetical protein PybrP1_002843 [[Pythium] brassicae (nom. inval.)]|nr:hypothetical protein PybrP1_002843 [[Pythium] brassicae (nom. inval.)]
MVSIVSISADSNAHRTQVATLLRFSPATPDTSSHTFVVMLVLASETLSVSTVAAAFVAVVLAAFAMPVGAALRRKLRIAKGLAPVPGPKGAPLLGMLPEVLKHAPRVHEYIEALMIQYGGRMKFPWSIFGNGAIWLASSEDIEWVLATNHDNYIRAERFTHAFGRVFSKSFLGLNHAHTPDNGAMVRLQRKVSVRVFTTANFKLFTEQVFRSYATDMVALVKQRGGKIDMHEVSSQYTLQAIFDISCGIPLKELDPSLGLAFIHAMDYVFAYTSERMNSRPYYRYLSWCMPSEYKMKRYEQVMIDLADAILLPRLRESDADVGRRSDILSLFIKKARELEKEEAQAPNRAGVGAAARTQGHLPARQHPGLHPQQEPHEERLREFGGIMKMPWHLFFDGAVYITDPEHVKHVLSTNFDNYVKPQGFIDAFHEVFEHSFFAMNHAHTPDSGAKWRLQRKVAAKVFTASNFRVFTEQVFAKYAHDVVREVTEAQARGARSFDMQELCAQYTLQSIFDIAFGVPLPEVVDPRAFAASMSFVNEHCASRLFVKQYYKLLKWCMPSEYRLRRETDVIRGVADRILSRRLLESDAELASRSDILSLFIKKARALGADSAALLDAATLRSIALTFIFAGRDTTAECITYAFYGIARHPAVQQRIVDEVRVSCRGGDGALAYEDVKGLRYLDAVVHEAVRLYPALPYNVKMAVRDDHLPGGVFVPAGCDVIPAHEAQERGYVLKSGLFMAGGLPLEMAPRSSAARA